jgi:peptidoglycan hydrolase-like protein with peptidoglycan-binding domain
MITDFATSNLSKIKPKLRTSGVISQPRRKAGSSLNDLGGNGNIGITQQEYLNRLYYAFDNTTDTQLRQFLYQEIKKIHIQRGTW